MSLFLPAPTRNVNAGAPSRPSGTTASSASASSTGASAASSTGRRLNAPSYESRCSAAAAAAALTQKSNSNSQKSEKPKLFVPRSLADFDDGGSFPEIHVAQYPRHMGNPHLAKKRAGASGANSGGGGSGGGGSSNTPSGRVTSSNKTLLTTEIDATGEISYDAIVTGGTNSTTKVYTAHTDLRGHNPTTDEIALPTDAEERNTAQRTMEALGVITTAKTALARPSGTALMQAATSKNQEDKTQFIRYTPRTDAPGYNPSTAPQRVIQMVPAQLDPMAPPKHQHRKAPRGPADDPVPVLHSPSEKLSKEEREQWNIPACISNWKNTRGYTIPLDKRLAADGRGLREDTTINTNFATLSESLYVAERQAREEVKMRAVVKKRLVIEERERREEELRNLAGRARRERAGVAVGGVGDTNEVTTSGMDGRNIVPEEDIDGPPQPYSAATAASASASSSTAVAAAAPGRGPTDDEVAAQQRERLRQERRRERERELRMEHRGGSGAGAGGAGGGTAADDEEDEEGVAVKKRRLEDDRDISEKIALGTHTGTGGAGNGNNDVDARLYNQSSGMDSGFGPEDDYNVYTQPMFGRDGGGVSSSSIYRPTRGEGMQGDADEQYGALKAGATAKFQPDRAFNGADGGGGSSGGAGPRTAPVQFERGGEK
mmetsp:Transcript_33354/g.73135  ORF Transcript_33354/g.73135 Transcript_33354/m.73135 type:complete len:660 (+) Transcript_33354:91-2070(+)